jgi:hypothetical protein
LSFCAAVVDAVFLPGLGFVERYACPEYKTDCKQPCFGSSSSVSLEVPTLTPPPPPPHPPANPDGSRGFFSSWQFELWLIDSENL